MSARAPTLCLLLVVSACARTGFEPPEPPSGSELDLGPELSFDRAVQEVAEGAGSASFTLLLSEPSQVEVTAPFSVGGSATPGADHDLADGVVVIPAGQTSHAVSFSLTDDDDFEPGEYILITLGVPTYAHRGPLGAHTITLLDDDQTPALAFIDSAVAATEGGGAVDLRVKLSAVTPFDVTVNYSLGGSANSEDYQDVSGDVEILAGALEATLRFNIIDDVPYEPNEELVVSLGAPANALLGTPSQATVTILDNDGVPPQLGLTDQRTCAVVEGSLRCWGTGCCGELGVDEFPDDLFYSSSALTATSVPAGVVTSVATGNYHTCVVVEGGAYCFGKGAYGAFGRGEGVSDDGAPTGLERGVHMVASAGDSSCAVKDGALSCWGSNSDGNLGTGDRDQRWEPTTLAGLEQGVTFVALAKTHGCAIKDSALYCWGSNWAGQLGLGTNEEHLTPTPVPALQSGVTWVAVELDRSCAVAGGAAHCWGINNHGQIGDGTTEWSTLPEPVQGLDSGVSAIAVAVDHSCAVVDGGVRCWGRNDHGQAGEASFTDRLVPTQVLSAGPGVEAIDVALGGVHTCALLRSGEVRCWGWGGVGQLGDGLPHHLERPTPVSGLSTLVSLSSCSGACASCGVTVSGGARCWGCNDDGQLGDGTNTDRAVPVAVSGLALGTTLVTPGSFHSCALAGDAVSCWGSGGFGQLGDGDRADSPTPITPIGLGSGVSDLAVGDNHSCAIVAGALSCWGINYAGQLGVGDRDGRIAPEPVTQLIGAVTAVAAAGEHTCAVAAGSLYCWGHAADGRLGDNSDSGEQLLPVAVQGLPAGIIEAVSLGARHSCAIVSGDLYCWGDNSSGQLGIDGPEQLTAAAVTDLPVGAITSISAGGIHTCAVVNTELYCWGEGYMGQLGLGDTVERYVPTQVSALQGEMLIEVSSGSKHTCARALNQVWCWGSCGSGQTGTDCLVVSADPVTVTGL